MRTERPTCRECACTKVCEYFANENNRNLDEVCPLCMWENYFAPKREWISVEDRLPEKSGEYLTCRCGDLMAVLQYSAVHKLFNALDDRPEDYSKQFAVTVEYWMPLPEAPKMKGGE